MDKPGGRFNLRARKSLKLFGQVECSLCKRHYFPVETDDDENDEKTDNLCCNCEKLKSTDADANVIKRNRRQTTVKAEKHDPSYDEAEDSARDVKPEPMSKRQRKSNVESTNTANLTKPSTSTSKNLKQITVSGEKINNARIKVTTYSMAAQSTSDMDDGDETPAQKPPVEITKTDTEHSLRQKFPKVNPFELEFMMYLKQRDPDEL